MIVYHGSNTLFERPDLKYSRKELDFSKGFYVTELYEQAKKWSERKRSMDLKVKSYVLRFELDEMAFLNKKVLKFDTYSKEWLDFISVCRSGNDKTDYDIVIGGIANDKVFDTIELYFDNLISADEAIGRLKYEKINSQICLRKQEIIDRYLKYIGVDEIYGK